ncbi:MAG TPA: hypothetical protein VHV30_02635 [Polyangiaceae bacterium]|nr:hypothetical protein [Polyangiaceae bacterium]
MLAIAACSSSSNSDNGGGDASTSDAGGEAGMPPIGVPLASCAGCPICGGALVTPDSGVSFCTVDCTTDSDCPAGSGTACIASINSPGMGLSNECIKTCSADGDCQSPFVCRHDLATPGGYCWSPYGETDASTPIPEAGVDSGASDGGTPESGATPDSGAADSGGADAADAGTTPDASNDGPSE